MNWWIIVHGTLDRRTKPNQTPFHFHPTWKAISSHTLLLKPSYLDDNNANVDIRNATILRLKQEVTAQKRFEIFGYDGKTTENYVTRSKTIRSSRRLTHVSVSGVEAHAVTTSATSSPLRRTCRCESWLDCCSDDDVASPRKPTRSRVGGVKLNISRISRLGVIVAIGENVCLLFV